MANPRHTYIRGDKIEYSFWLVFDATGGMRFSRGQPSVSRGERAMACTASLPRNIFRTPELKATIAVGETVPAEFKLDIEAASDALKGALGVDVDLRVEMPNG